MLWSVILRCCDVDNRTGTFDDDSRNAGLTSLPHFSGRFKISSSSVRGMGVPDAAGRSWRWRGLPVGVRAATRSPAPARIDDHQEGGAAVGVASAALGCWNIPHTHKDSHKQANTHTGRRNSSTGWLGRIERMGGRRPGSSGRTNVS